MKENNERWSDLLVVVVLVLVVEGTVAIVFVKTIGNTIAIASIKTKVNINANVRGQVTHPKHPFVDLGLSDWEGIASSGNFGVVDPINAESEDFHRCDACNSNDEDN